MPRQPTQRQEFRNERDAEKLTAAAAAVHRRTGLARYGQATVVGEFSGFTLAALLRELAESVAELPSSTRSLAVRLAEMLVREDEPSKPAGITGL